MSVKSQQFKREVIELINSYDGRLDVGEHYDQNEEPIGETEYIIVDGERFTLSDFFPSML